MGRHCFLKIANSREVGRDAREHLLFICDGEQVALNDGTLSGQSLNGRGL